MPYGLPDNVDTPKNRRKMERCVNKLTKDPDFKPRGKDSKKLAAIKVCKSRIMGKTTKHKK